LGHAKLKKREKKGNTVSRGPLKLGESVCVKKARHTTTPPCGGREIYLPQDSVGFVQPNPLGGTGKNNLRSTTETSRGEDARKKGGMGRILGTAFRGKTLGGADCARNGGMGGGPPGYRAMIKIIKNLGLWVSDHCAHQNPSHGHEAGILAVPMAVTGKSRPRPS